jgi:short-subunit dehydrogenase
MSGTVLILGASSSIARAISAAFAKQGFSLYLAGRDGEDLARLASDLEVRYGKRVKWGSFDAEDYSSHEATLEKVLEEVGSVEGVVLAFGHLGEQTEVARDFSAAQRVISSNFAGAVSILISCGAYFEKRGSGFIIALSSVAGERGRARNYTYGAAKGALSLYLQGLRARLLKSGVRVITVKLGFVDTAMTFGMPGLFLVAAPDYVGERIVRTLAGSRDVIYLPWFWRWIMWIVRLIPETLFKRLSS